MEARHLGPGPGRQGLEGRAWKAEPGRQSLEGRAWTEALLHGTSKHLGQGTRRVLRKTMLGVTAAFQREHVPGRSYKFLGQCQVQAASGSLNAAQEGLRAALGIGCLFKVLANRWHVSGICQAQSAAQRALFLCLGCVGCQGRLGCLGAWGVSGV